MATPSLNRAPSIIALLRVSSDGQDVQRQRTDVEKLKKKFGVKVVRTLELFGVSGTATLDDKQIQQILTDLALTEIDGIAVSSLDRLFRPKHYGAFAILDPFVAAGKRIWSAREGEIDPGTDEGYDKCISAGGRAGAEWRELRRRTSDGRREKLNEGLLDHGSAPFAYTYVTKHQDNGRRFDVDPSRAQVVKDVFEWRKTGMSVYAIAKRLNDRGILSAGFRSRKAGKSKAPGLWSRQVIVQMLRNPTYVGRHVRAGVTIECPAIIDRATFDDVQAVTALSRAKNVGSPRTDTS